MFKPGQKVVCITNKLDGVEVGVSGTKVGKIYTVITCFYYNCEKPDYWLTLRELERYVKSKRFVPLEDWKQAETMVEVLKEDLELVEVV